MRRIGIDIGSTYTKYCVLPECGGQPELYAEKTPVRQTEYFTGKYNSLREQYGNIKIVSCGYGRKNVEAFGCINELSALARGAAFTVPGADTILDIGGQDTKLIRHQDGRLRDFFVNGKCAAGSGMFLAGTCAMLEEELGSIDLTGAGRPEISLSSVCAVFAQSEIVKLLSDNVPPESIIRAVIWQILIKAKPLLSKVRAERVVLSGGLTNIPGIETFADLALETECVLPDNGQYLSAIGCALWN